MKSRPLLLFAAVPGLMLLLLGLSIFLLLEKVEDTETRPPGPRARANPLLALERTLSRLGHTASSAPALPPLAVPPDEGPFPTVVVMPGSGRLTESDADRLLSRVEEGWRLVYSPPDFEADPILDLLRVEMVPGDPGGAKTSTVRDPEDPGGPWTLSGDGVAWFTGDGELGWVGGHDPAAPERFGVGTLNYGYGEIVLIADATPFTNEHLGEADNAAFFAEYILVGQPTEVQIVYELELEGMLTLLARLAWPATVAGAALLLAWIWRSSRRFGTVYGEAPAERRSLLQHIDAVGAFAWRRGHAQALLDHLRASVLAGEGPDEPEARVRWLVKRTRCPEGLVRLALSTPTDDNPLAFTEIVRALETLRRSR